MDEAEGSSDHVFEVDGSRGTLIFSVDSGETKSLEFDNKVTLKVVFKDKSIASKNGEAMSCPSNLIVQSEGSADLEKNDKRLNENNIDDQNNKQNVEKCNVDENTKTNLQKDETVDRSNSENVEGKNKACKSKNQTALDNVNDNKIDVVMVKGQMKAEKRKDEDSASTRKTKKNKTNNLVDDSLAGVSSPLDATNRRRSTRQRKIKREYSPEPISSPSIRKRKVAEINDEPSKGKKSSVKDKQETEKGKKKALLTKERKDDDKSTQHEEYNENNKEEADSQNEKLNLLGSVSLVSVESRNRMMKEKNESKENSPENSNKEEVKTTEPMQDSVELMKKKESDNVEKHEEHDPGETNVEKSNNVSNETRNVAAGKKKGHIQVKLKRGRKPGQKKVKVEKSNDDEDGVGGDDEELKGNLTKLQDILCKYCNVTFKHKLAFREHRRTEWGVFKCDVCDKVEPYKAYLLVHQQLYHNGDESVKHLKRLSSRLLKGIRLTCQFCHHTFAGLESLKIHVLHHTGETVYKCCICPERFNNHGSLRHHLHVHVYGESVSCLKCNLEFKTRAELAKHKLTHEHICGFCGESFPNKTSKNDHYLTKHKDVVIKCEDCYHVFATNEELEIHRKHHIKFKKEVCPICGAMVRKMKYHLKTHAQAPDYRPFKCDQCDMAYKKKNNLQKHKLIHTGERPFQCNQCPKAFRSTGLLRKHLYTHSNERPHKCEKCGKGFGFKSTLLTHMKVHSDKFEFKCPKCDKGFHYRTSLRIHMKSRHKPDEPSTYQCPLCSTAPIFIGLEAFSSHIVNAHPEAEIINKIETSTSGNPNGPDVIIITNEPETGIDVKEEGSNAENEPNEIMANVDQGYLQAVIADTFATKGTIQGGHFEVEYHPV